jgi:hypothetical protein
MNLFLFPLTDCCSLTDNNLNFLSFFTFQQLKMICTEGRTNTNGDINGAIRLLFTGVMPRVTWIGIGGFVFFGAYEKSKQTLLS